jgi:hypothetical protein
LICSKPVAPISADRPVFPTFPIATFIGDGRLISPREQKRYSCCFMVITYAKLAMIITTFHLPFLKRFVKKPGGKFPLTESESDFFFRNGPWLFKSKDRRVQGKKRQMNINNTHKNGGSEQAREEW